MNILSTSIFSRRIFVHLSILCAVVATSLIMSASVAHAIIVPIGNHSFDSDIPASGILEFNGTNFVTPGPVEISNFNVRVDGGSLGTQLFANSKFVITGGFSEAGTTLTDTDFNGIDLGDIVSTTIGAGTFEIQNGLGTIIYGSFSTGQFTSVYGSTSGAGFSADLLGLDLVPGPAFTFDNTYVSSILDPEGFGFSLSNIPSTVNANYVLGPFGSTYIVDLQPFSSSAGSVTASGQIVVVPEPSTIGLGIVGLAGLGMLTRRRKTA